MPNNLLRSGFKAIVYVLVTIALTLGLGVTSVYAYYAPGETLNPTCAPNASGCDIDPTMPVTAGGTGLTSVSTGDLLYASASNTLSKLSIGNNGKILKVVGNNLSWEDDLGGVSYYASEQGVHLNTTTNIFSLVLNGNSLTQSSAGLSISPGYTGQSSIATLGTITSGTWSGTAIGSSYGGTGITATPAIGQILIGSGTGYNLGSLTAIATSGIKIANGASNINFSFDFNLLNSVTSASGSNDYLMVYNGASGSNKKITYADLFRDFEGSLKYQGIWNASTNVPDINSAATTSGFFYIVQTAGTSTVNGISEWSVGDWVIYSSTGWEKVQSTNLVNSVFGRVGTIVAEYGDYSADKITTVTSTKLSATNVQAAIDEIVNSMQSTIATSTTGTYYRGDKTWVTLDTAAVLENAGYLYFTNDRAREALSVAVGQGFSFDTSTGIFALDANRSLPYKGSTFGEMLVWDGTNWVSTSTVASYISGLGVSNFTTDTISQWKNDIGYLTIVSSTGNNLFWDGSSLVVTSSPTFDSLSLLTNGLYLASSSPAGTTSTLYNLGGKLYFNGAPVNSSATIDDGSVTGQIAYWNGSGWVAGPSLVLYDGLLSLAGTVSSTNIVNAGTVTTTDLNAVNVNTTNVTSTNGWFTNLLSSLSAYFTNLIVDNATTTNFVATGSTTLANLNVNGDTVLSTTTISDLIVNGNILGNNGVKLADNLPTVTSSNLYNVGGKLFWNGKQLAETTTGTLNIGDTEGDMLYWNGTTWDPTSLLNFNISGKQLTIGSSTSAIALNVYGTSTLNNSLFVNGNSLLNTTSISYLNVTGNSAFNTITSGTWNGNAIGIAYGGLGITSTPGFGKILMGDGSGYLLGAITATSGLSVSNSTGTIELSLNIPSLKLSNTMNGEDQFIFYSSSSNSNQRVSYNDVFGSVLGSLNYRGTWNPVTNDPAISAATCTSTFKGYYFVASTSTTSSVAIAGLDTWTANDWLVCNGANWERIQTTNAVTSVFGRTGAIGAEAGDYNALKIDFAPTSSISSTNVQDAIKELAEKTGSGGGNLGDILSWNGTKWVSTSTLSLSNGNIYFTGSLIPSAPGVFDIGSETNFVRDLYISSNSLKIAGQSLSNNNGVLSWGGSALNVGGFSVAGNNSTSTGSMSIGGALTVAGQSAFLGDITSNGGILLTGNVTSSQIYATTGTFANLLVINPATFANLNWTNATGTNLMMTGDTNLATTTMLGLTITQNGLIISSSTPNTTTQALYAIGSELYWNGSKVGSGGGLDWATTTVDSVTAPFGLTPNSSTSTGIGTDGLAMWLGTSSTARVYVAQNGDVGIGMVNPSEELHILERSSAGSINSGNQLVLEAKNDRAGLKFLSPDKSTSTIQFADDDTMYFDTPALSGGFKFFQDDGTNLLTIASSGNVGIGTTGPTIKLHVATSDTKLSSNGNKNIAFFSSSSTEDKPLGLSIGIIGGGNSTDRKAYITGTEFGSNFNDVLINPWGGNVGIGTSSPSRKLEVNGIVRLPNNNQLEWGGANVMIFGNDSTNSLNLATGGTAKLTINTDGNVGIGTTSPTHKLYIVDTNTTTNRKGLYVVQAGAVPGTGYAIYGSKSGAGTTNVGGYFSAAGATNNYGLLVNSGLVGIGTAAPEHEMSIYSTTGSDLSLDGGTNDSHNIHFQESGTDFFAIRYDGGSANPDNKLKFMTASADTGINTTAMTLTQSGYLGLGLTSPSVKLDVSGDIEYTGTITDVSDASLKENIVSLNGSLDKLMKLNAISFNMIDDESKKKELGFTAQNVRDYFPDLVSIVDPENGTLGLNYVGLIAPIVQSIQEEHSLNASTTIGLQLDLSANNLLTNANTLAMFGTTINALDLTNPSTIFVTDTLAIDTEVSSTISGVSSTVNNVNVTSTVDYIKAKIAGGYSYLREFVAVRVDAVTGWFDQIFARKVNVKEQICIGDTCITQDQLKQILDKSNQTSSQNYSTNSGSSDNSSSQTDNTATTGNITGSTTATTTAETETDTSTVVVNETVNTENTTTSGSSEGTATDSSTESSNNQEAATTGVEIEDPAPTNTSENGSGEVSGN